MAPISIPADLRRLVETRANRRCEYRLVSQDDAEAPHQIDHLIAIKHGGQTVEENLALACQLCNRYKGSYLSTIDSVTGGVVPLFSPRTQAWSEHFELAARRILGLTAIGRATIQLLRLNEEARLIDREALIEAGRYPPSL